MHPLTAKARRVLDSLVDAFDCPEVLVDTLARATLIPNSSPCRKWSPANRILTALHGTGDARGYRQWQQVGRQVRRGAKSFSILVPRFKQDEDDEERLIGFIAAPVFRLEDTEGDLLPETEPTRIPRLRELADELGIKVRYSGVVSDRVLGAYGQDRITLYTHDLSTFYHELSHALHSRTGLLRDGRTKEDRRDNETVAEVTAAVLVKIFEGEEVGKQAIEYIQAYGAGKAHLLGLLQEIQTVLDYAFRRSTESPLEAVNG